MDKFHKLLSFASNINIILIKGGAERTDVFKLNTSVILTHISVLISEPKFGLFKPYIFVSKSEDGNKKQV